MTVRRQKFYQITTKERTADVSIYGDITGNAELIKGGKLSDLKK